MSLPEGKVCAWALRRWLGREAPPALCLCGPGGQAGVASEQSRRRNSSAEVRQREGRALSGLGPSSSSSRVPWAPGRSKPEAPVSSVGRPVELIPISQERTLRPRQVHAHTQSERAIVIMPSFRGADWVPREGGELAQGHPLVGAPARTQARQPGPGPCSDHLVCL